MKQIMAALLIALSIGVSVPAPAGDEVRLTESERIYGLSQIWKEASYNFAFFDQVPDLDLDVEFRAHLPWVLDAINTYEYYRVLQRFCALLEDGHTNVYIPDDLRKRHEDQPAIQTREAGGQAIVTRIEASLATVVPPGSVVMSVDGIETGTYLRERIFPYICSSTEHIRWSNGVRQLLVGKPGSEVALEIRRPDGSMTTLTAMRDAGSRDVTWTDYMGRRRGDALLEINWLDDQIVYVALNSFGDQHIVDEFKARWDEIKTARGVILDLRFNCGGSTDVGTAILAHFTDTPLTGSAWRSRKHVAVYKAWSFFADRYESLAEYRSYATGDVWETGGQSTLEPGVEAIVVPVVVLIGRETASAAEDFLIYADTLEHVITVGEPTFGSTGQPLSFPLPGGGQCRICTKRDTYPDGRDFVGVGVLPDVPVERAATYYLDDRDEELVTAMQVIRGQIDRD